MRELFVSEMKRPLENRIDELTTKLSELRVDANVERSILENKDSPTVRICSLIEELLRCAGEIDLAEFMSSESRRGQSFKDCESQARKIMQQPVKVGDETLDLLSVIVMLVLKHPCVATAASVAVLRSHDRGVTSKAIYHYVRHYLGHQLGKNAGSRRGNWPDLGKQFK